MFIEGIFKGISRDKSIRVQSLHRETPIPLREGNLSPGILRMYLSVKNAEFPGIEDERRELYQALGGKYRGFPELIFLGDYLINEGYGRVW